MSKKKQEKFRDIWVNQTTLGKQFNLSAVAIGKKLKEQGLREAEGKPTDKALSEGYCRETPLKDGTPFFLWHKAKVADLLREDGLKSLTAQELRCRELAQRFIEAECLLERGDDKLAYFMQDDIESEIQPGDILFINRFLKELGSSQQLEEN